MDERAGRSASGAAITVAACVLAALCEGFDLQAAGVAAGGLAAEFKPTPDQMGTFFSASTFGLFLGALVGGRLSDSFGRKRLLVASVAAFAIFSIATGRAWSIDSLIVGRLFTGFGLGGAFPVLVALVNERSSAHRRRANVALVYSAMPFGGSIVSLMSMVIAPTHWRSIFVVGGVLPLLLTPVMQWAVRESRARAVADAVAGAARAAAESGLEAKKFKAIFASGRALPTVLLWVSSFLGLLILYLLLSWLPTLLVEAGFSKVQAAGAQIGFNIGGGLAALLLGQLLESRYRYPSLIVTFIAAPLLVFWLSKTPGDFATVVAITFALGGAVIAIQGYLYAAGALVYPTAIRGAGMGATVAAGRSGSIVGPKLGGALKAAGLGPAQVLGDFVPLVILGSVAALAFTWMIGRRGGGQG